MKLDGTITQERLKELVNYDSETGIFTRKNPHKNRYNDGVEINCKDRKGYIRAQIEGRMYFFHRLAWLYVYGVLPEYQIDHKNGIKHDNRIDNLREATNSQNTCNRKVRIDSGSGFKGVHLDKRTNRWRAKITINKKSIGLGFYASKDEAIKARKAAAYLHGEYYREN